VKGCVVDEVQTVKAGGRSQPASTRTGARAGRAGPAGRIRPPDRVKERKHLRREVARRRAHAAAAAIKSGIDRGELEDIVAEPLDEHVDLLGTGPVVHS
jgi:hypothetical protein